MGTLFYYLYVPETMGRSLEQITLDFKRRAGEDDKSTAPVHVENPVVEAAP